MIGAVLVIGGLALLGSVEKGLNPNATLISVNEKFSPSGTRVTAAWEGDASLDVATST